MIWREFCQSLLGYGTWNNVLPNLCQHATCKCLCMWRMWRSSSTPFLLPGCFHLHYKTSAVFLSNPQTHTKSALHSLIHRIELLSQFEPRRGI